MIHKTTRSILSVLLAALLLVTSTPLTPAFAGEEGAVPLQSESGESEGLAGAGTKENPYKIATAEELEEFAELVNDDGKTSAWAELTADIDLSEICSEEKGVSWTPIGNSESTAYTGTFDGNGKTIENLYINNTTSDEDQGLFGRVNGGTVQNLSVSGSVSVSGGEHVGGIAGQNGGRITDCDFTGSVTSSGNFVGGVVGDNGGTVKNCYNTGTVTGTVNVIGNSSFVGGVVGYNRGSVENCYNTGNISGNSYVGGVVGYNYPGASVENCYNTGSVNGSGNSVGGVVGYNGSGSVTNSYNTGEVSGYSHVGGVVGGNSDSTVENCYNTGSVNGSGNLYVGGVVGHNSISSSVTNCYNTGAVSGGEDAGGVVGYNHSGGTVTGCYFLQENGVPANGIGNGSGDAAAVDDLSDQDQFDGWDFIDTWRISTDEKRPVLQANAEDDALSGTGKQEDPYKIYRAIDLKNFRDLVNDGGAGASAHAKLMNDIDLNGSATNQWTPIGNSSNPYSGNFDGNNYTISGLYIDSRANDQGLFGYVGTGGTVKDLSVSGSVTSSVSGGEDVGGIVGYNNGGTVTNCAFSGSVSGKIDVGGVVGDNEGRVENCYNTGKVSGDAYVGGVVGYNDGGRVKNCYNTGTVTGTDDYVGGVVGYNDGGTVENCYYQQHNQAIFGIGGTTDDNIGQTEAKSLDDFQSGEVAYLLQSKQPAAEDGTIPQVWGQSNLNATTSLPTLNPTDEQKVYQVTFDYGTSFTDNDDRYDYRYANANDNVTLPTSTDQIPEYEGHTLTGWQNEDGQAVQGESVTITADTSYIAEWTANTYTITVTAGSGGTVSGSGEYSEGTEVTVTATPATGYHFVNWTENGTEVSTEATFTFNATVDRNLIAIFAKNEDPTPTPTPDPTPSGPSTGDSTGWDDILDELENTAKGDQITIDMGDETKVPAEIFESVAGKDVDVTFDLGDDLSWTVNGKDIPDDAALADLDLGVALDTDGIPANVVNAITGEVGTVQITLAHNGEFGFTMTLTAPLGKENAGYWANLYHYKVNGGEADREDPLGDDEDAEALNFEAAAKIDEDGSVTIPFTHASQYAIVIDTHSHATVDVSDIFVDVAPNAWYKDAIQYAYDNGLMTGTSANEFAPEQTTTRAMIVSILARLEGVESAQAAGFADVDDNDWYATAVNWAANVGVVNGYEDNTFRPNQPITREQLAAILMNYAAYKGEDVSARADLSAYTDQPSTWATDTMSWAVAEGLISGVTNDQLQPQSSATRAQVAAILQRLLEA